MNKIFVQGEANNRVVEGDRLFFHSPEAKFAVGQRVEFSNFSHTLTTEARITNAARDFYEAEIETDPVENILDLTHIRS